MILDQIELMEFGWIPTSNPNLGTQVTNSGLPMCCMVFSVMASSENGSPAHMRICNLRAGHSHEDVDGFFSGVTAHLEATAELHTPDQFRRCLERYLSNPAIRPNEPDRSVVMVESVRDWCLVLIVEFLALGAINLEFAL